ncbi:MAG TPA: hypothetical protein VLZ05_12145 [Mycobacterium sp.]|nr:hypothetical protein [Mycobacterium sp.]
MGKIPHALGALANAHYPASAPEGRHGPSNRTPGHDADLSLAATPPGRAPHRKPQVRSRQTIIHKATRWAPAGDVAGEI